MSKYDPLKEFLDKQNVSEVPMTFAAVEAVVGSPLPPAAYKHRAWWSNNRDSSVVTQAWWDAGFKTSDVDMTARRLIFRRRSDATGGSGIIAGDHIAEPSPAYAVRGRHPLFGALKGAARIVEVTDLTQPADPDWGKATR
jgi:hypothetical protein